MTRRTQRGEHATGPGARWGAWRAGWERLLADVLGWGGPDRTSLYDVLADADAPEAPWTPQELDALWAAAHADGAGRHGDAHRAVR